MKYCIKIVKPQKCNEVVAEFFFDTPKYLEYAESIQSMMSKDFEEKIRADIYEDGRFILGTM